MIDFNLWKNKKVFVTGHTGFKGSWLCLWLYSLGANVTGFALSPPTQPNMFELCKINELCTSHIDDIRNKESLYQAIYDASPDVVIHMAAQPIVRASYKNPVETYEINIMGTVYLLEAVRKAAQNGVPIKAVINVTTDKCYENQEWVWGYREIDPLGGYDAYSNSKACSELITACYRNCYFNPKEYPSHWVALASARAGNVIGGGDWAYDRLFPDCIRALLNGETIKIRNPQAIRPWQYVLEPLAGYLMLAQKLMDQGHAFANGWNFGPDDEDIKQVQWIVKQLCDKWGGNSAVQIEKGIHPHETNYLKLDSSNAKQKLGWYPRWNLDVALNKTIEWFRAFQDNQDLRKVCLHQINEYVTWGERK